MDQNDDLARQFQDHRPHLRRVAYQMLGSAGEADDAVQEAWIRLSRSDAAQIGNLRGWLTTVVARICLDLLRSRKNQNEEALEERVSDASPEDDPLLADSIGPALLIVLDRLNPAERVAFVLHDLFDFSFDEIAPVVGRSAMATRQLASRARRRVRSAKEGSRPDTQSQREIVSAFLAASRGGDFSALLQVLDPNVVLRADKTAIEVTRANRAKGAPPFENEIRGAKDVAEIFKGRATAAQLALIDGEVGTTWAPGGKPMVAFLFSVKEERIHEIHVMMNAEDLKELEVEVYSS